MLKKRVIAKMDRVETALLFLWGLLLILGLIACRSPFWWIFAVLNLVMIWILMAYPDIKKKLKEEKT